MIRIAEIDLPPGVEPLVLEVLRSGRLSQGPMTERFETLCAEMAGSQHAVAVSNGTVSLELALETLGIGEGDEVITTAFTFAATLNAILRAGATVRFADIDQTGTIEPRGIESLIGPRTAAVLPVHLYGLPADMVEIERIATARGLALIEDAAQAHGAEVGGRRVGSFGVGSFSFYATKNVTAGEGGVLTTSDPVLAEDLRVLRNQGMRERYEYIRVGHNYRLTEIQAAVAIPQLERLDAIVAARRENARKLSDRLSGVEGLQIPSDAGDRRHVWHQFTVLLPEGSDRNRVIEEMERGGVEARIYYPKLVWDHKPYVDDPRVVTGENPIAKSYSERCLSLPVHPKLSDDDIEQVARRLITTLGAK